MRTKCRSCGRTTHTYGGRCTVCGKTKPLFEPVEKVEQGLTDSDRQEIAGFGIVVGFFALLSLVIALIVATFG